MELSGNLWELTVTVGHSSGRGFEGRYHGNGALDSSGNPNVTTWPGTGAAGTGIRGGDWAGIASVSSRNNASKGFGGRGFGGRGVRVAP